MAVQVYLSAPFTRPSPKVVAQPRSSQQAPRGRRLRSISKGIWRLLVNAFSGPGLDDSAMPSSFEAPYGRGSRHVRSLWHMPF